MPSTIDSWPLRSNPPPVVVRPRTARVRRSTLPPIPAKYEAYLSCNSTRASSEVGDDEQIDGTDGESEPSPDEMQYPTGWPFAFIVIALVLGIFLVSLDMVCHRPSSVPI